MRFKQSFLTVGLISSSLTFYAFACANVRTQKHQSPLPTIGDESVVPVGWKRYKLRDEPAVSIALPSEPEHLSHDSGAKELTSVFLSNKGTDVYGAAFLNDLPASARSSEESGRDFIFDTFIKPFVMSFQNFAGLDNADLQFQILEERRVKMSSNDALEQDFMIGSFHGRMRMTRVGTVGIYAVTIWKESIPSADQALFFDSIKIENRPEANLNSQ